MTKVEDLSGRRFGMLVVVNLCERTACGRVRWLCKCDCGNTSQSTANNLKRGLSSCCGCLRDERTRKLNLRHGHLSHGKRPSEYAVWNKMLNRCLNDKAPDFKDYGGRGIMVCEEWMNSYQNFFDDMGKRPSNLHTIERINNNGNYEPDNCRWATRKEQANNRRPYPKNRKSQQRHLK